MLELQFVCSLYVCVCVCLWFSHGVIHVVVLYCPRLCLRRLGDKVLLLLLLLLYKSVLDICCFFFLHVMSEGK